jgi:hypothetical protein
MIKSRSASQRKMESRWSERYLAPGMSFPVSLFRIMAATDPRGASVPEEEVDYVWDKRPENQPPPEVFQLWKEMGERLDLIDEGEDR